MSASLRAAWIRAEDCGGLVGGGGKGKRWKGQRWWGEGEGVLTSSSISLRVLRPLAAKKSSRGFCSSLGDV